MSDSTMHANNCMIKEMQAKINIEAKISAK